MYPVSLGGARTSILSSKCFVPGIKLLEGEQQQLSNEGSWLEGDSARAGGGKNPYLSCVIIVNDPWENLNPLEGGAGSANNETKGVQLQGPVHTGVKELGPHFRGSY